MLRYSPHFCFHRQGSVPLNTNKIPQAGTANKSAGAYVQQSHGYLCLSALSLCSCIFCIQSQLFQVSLLPLQLQLLPLLHAKMHVRTFISPVKAVRYALNAPVQQKHTLSLRLLLGLGDCSGQVKKLDMRWIQAGRSLSASFGALADRAACTPQHMPAPAGRRRPCPPL